MGDVDDSRVIVIHHGSDQRQVESALREARGRAERAKHTKSGFLAAAGPDARQLVQTLAFLNGIVRLTVTEPEALDALSQQVRAIGVMSRLLNSLPNIKKRKSGGATAAGVSPTRCMPRAGASTPSAYGE